MTNDEIRTLRADRAHDDGWYSDLTVVQLCDLLIEARADAWYAVQHAQGVNGIRSNMPREQWARIEGYKP